jgi:hypothetical protein
MKLLCCCPVHSCATLNFTHHWYVSRRVVLCSYGRLEVHARLLLPVPQLASEAAAAPALACQPLVVSMAHLLSPPAFPPASAQDMVALWASLPVQVWYNSAAAWCRVCLQHVVCSASNI